MSRNLKLFMFIAGIALFLVWLSSRAAGPDSDQEVETLTYSQFRAMLTPAGQKKIGTLISRPDLRIPGRSSLFDASEASFVLRIYPRRITGRYFKPGMRLEKSDDPERIRSRTLPFAVESLPGTVSDDLLRKLEANNLAYEFANEEDDGILSTLTTLLPIILIVALIWIFMMRQLQSAGNRALAFSKSKARLNPENKKKITFKDVAGCDEAKYELEEVVDFLKNPRKFQTIGAKIPKGVLLIGPPGTGKTLLARAVAGEADAPFYSISGSDFVEMFVGVGASRVRDLFEQAKKNSPCIIFIDEIDAVGRLRGAGLGGGHDEREQTLNQMLVEMDGFDENEGVIVVAATNRPDVLDPALLRPGRFDRQVVVDAPDVRGREAILRIHAAKIPLAPKVSLAEIARGTPGFTGADLANLINEATLVAARHNKRHVETADLEEAKDKVMMGPERRSFLITPKEKEVIAYHEGGHALLGSLLPYSEPVHKVTIIPRGRALGLTQSLPEEDRHIQPSRYWEDRICVLMGGYLAEDIIFGDTSTGASNDILTTTKIARRMVCEWGMSDKLGTVSYANDHESVFLGREMAQSRSYSDKTASAIDQEVRRIVQNQQDRGRTLLTKNRSKLEQIAKALLDYESINATQLEEIVHPDRSKVAQKEKAKEKAKGKAKEKAKGQVAEDKGKGLKGEEERPGEYPKELGDMEPSASPVPAA